MRTCPGETAEAYYTLTTAMSMAIRLNIDDTPKGARIKQLSSDHGPMHPPNVADIVQWVRVKDNEIRALARRYNS